MIPTSHLMSGPRPRLRVRYALILAALTAGAAFAQPSTPFVVNVPGDGPDQTPGDGVCAMAGGGCSLRAAVEENMALAAPPGARLPAGEYLLTLGPIVISRSMALIGDDPLTTRVNANGNRGFTLQAPAAGPIISLTNLTVYNGQMPESDGRAGGLFIEEVHVNLVGVHVLDCSAGWLAGGIFNDGSLHMQSSRVARCRVPRSDATGVEGRGGGILSQGNLEIFTSEFSDNSGTSGGAIYSIGGLSVTNSTFSGNQVTNKGGGIFHFGTGANGARLNFCTFTQNSTWVEPDPGRSRPAVSETNIPGGGAIYNVGLMSMGSTIAAGNVDLRSPANPSPDCWSAPHLQTVFNEQTGEFEQVMVTPTFTSFRNNVVGFLDPGSCNLIDQTWPDLRFDQVGGPGEILDAGLAPLDRYGGATSTHALLAGSPAINEGSTAFGGSFFDCPARDQRGVPRPVQDGNPGPGACDAGAFELTAQTDWFEAEDGSATGAFFEAVPDAGASGGFHAWVPPNLPGSMDAPNEQQHLDLKVYVENPGYFNIEGWVRAANIDQNSFWVKVDGLPEAGYLWDLPAGGSAFQADMISHRGTGAEGSPQIDPVQFYLARGVHTVAIYVRESGAQLDRIRLVPVPSAFTRLEVEHSAVLSGAFLVGNDPLAGTGKYVYMPPGSPEFLAAPDPAHKVTQTVTVAAAGTYLIRAGVRAVFDHQNSFWVKVDGQPGNGWLWDMTESNSTYGTDYVSHRGSGDSRNPEQDPVEVTLSAGTHTIEIFAREAGTRLDYIALEPKPAGGFVCEGACLSAEPTERYQTKVLNTTGERWYVVTDVITGWQASEVAGREIFVNGVKRTPGQMPLPGRVDGKYYFRFSPGTHPWASWSFWN